MVLLQPKLNLKVTQKQLLTPGLVQMVSVLALNKIELKDMINAEMMENPVLEELDEQVPMLDEVAGKEAQRDLPAEAAAEAATKPGGKDDPFEQIDFGSFFQEYLDPGYRSPESEFVEKPSFENFISKPTTLTEHLMWQLGSMHVSPAVYRAAELVIGNLNEDGYLIASNEELLAAARGEKPAKQVETTTLAAVEQESEATRAEGVPSDSLGIPIMAASTGVESASAQNTAESPDTAVAVLDPPQAEPVPAAPIVPTMAAAATAEETASARAPIAMEDLRDAIEVVRQMDPIGVAARDLRECLLLQLEHLAEMPVKRNGNGNGITLQEEAQVLNDAIRIVDSHLHQVQNKQFKEIGRAISRPIEAVNKAVELIRTLDPRPGLRYNKVEPRLIEPDVAFVKHGDEYLVVLNDEDVPQLRLSPTYKRLLNRDAADKDVRGYVKERYKSAIQLIKNIEQRKQTILKVCYAILGRQRDFLDKGIDELKPMMIKEVAEEIGVHPSTVSRAVANKYAHTPQGVFELRYFFSESVNGPEGGNTSLLILKRRVKKLIEEEDASKPLTDEQITRVLQSQGIQVTRRTVAKYREDMGIPSTHQRRVKH